jgi:hypothetical protein
MFIPAGLLPLCIRNDAYSNKGNKPAGINIFKRDLHRQNMHGNEIAHQSPIIASVAPTFTMALMVVSVFLDRLFPNQIMNNALWVTAIILNAAIVSLKVKTIFKRNTRIIKRPV